MTTILADHKRGIMVSDTAISDDNRVWRLRKIHRIGDSIVGLAGDVSEFHAFLDWFRDGMSRDPTFRFGESSALILRPSGLYLFEDKHTSPIRVAGGVEAIGSGAKAAICAYEAMHKKDPIKAVRIVCRHDSGSRAPVISLTIKPKAQ